MTPRSAGRCFLVSRKGEGEKLGLPPFARVALEVARSLFPPYRSRFKHKFTRL